MGDSQGLVIPVRLDSTRAVAGLERIETSGRRMGAEVAKGGDAAASGLGRAAQAAHGVGSELAGLMRAQMSLGAIKAVGGAIATQFDESARYIAAAAKEFAVLRKSMQEVATLKGTANTGQFTLEEARKAQKFNLMPTEFRDFQAEFQNYAGSQIGGPNGKLTEAQGEDYAGRVAELMKSSGISPAVGAELAGSLLENAKGPQDVDALMKRLSTTFQVLEKGRVPLSRALPQMSQIMGHGIEAEQAAQLFSIASPVSPGQEGVAVESALKAVEEMKNKGTGEEFGVTRGMGQFESVKAFAENIAGRKQGLMASGMSEQMAQDQLNALLAEKGVAADVRERRGLIAGFGRQGIELGGFERYGRIAEETPADFEASRKARYENSEQGRQDRVDAAHAVEQAAMGERNQELMKRRTIAETELTKAGRFEQFGMNQVRGGISQFFGGAGDRDIQTNRQMIARMRAELGEEASALDNPASLNNSATDALMRDMIRRRDEARTIKAPTADVEAAMVKEPVAGAGSPAPHAERGSPKAPTGGVEAKKLKAPLVDAGASETDAARAAMPRPAATAEPVRGERAARAEAGGRDDVPKLLERQNQILERQLALAEAAARPKSRPLSAPPPNPSGRMTS